MPAETDPTPTPAPAATPPPAPAPPAASPTIALSIDEFQRYRALEAQLADYNRTRAEELQTKENARLKAIADKEGAERALGEQRATFEAKHAESLATFQSLDQEVNSEKRDAVIAASLAGKTFVGATPDEQRQSAQDFFDFIKPRFETVKDGQGARVVREKGTGRLASEVLGELVASKRYEHFFAGSVPSGSGASGGTRPAPTGSTTTVDPLLAHAAAFKERQGKYQSFGLTRVS